MIDALITQFFAWAPLTVFVIVLVVAYFTTRGEAAGTTTAHGKTFACAQCGRRGKHEHMVPVSSQGAVVWYCGRCSHA